MAGGGSFGRIGGGGAGDDSEDSDDTDEEDADEIGRNLDLGSMRKRLENTNNSQDKKSKTKSLKETPTSKKNLSLLKFNDEIRALE